MDDNQLTQPTPEELRDLIKRHDLTRGEAAELVHASKRTWDNWSAKEDARDFRNIPMAVYELLLIKLGEHGEYGKLK